MADCHRLFLVPSDSDDVYITLSTGALPPVAFSPVILPWNRHLDLQTGLALATKKPQNGLEFLAGMDYKP